MGNTGPVYLTDTRQDAELHPLADISNKEIEEVKHLKHPPREVARVMEVVHLLLTQPSVTAPCDWSDVLRTVVRTDFLKRARSINLDDVLQQAKLIDYVCRKQLGWTKKLGGKRKDRNSKPGRRKVLILVLQQGSIFENCNFLNGREGVLGQPMRLVHPLDPIEIQSPPSSV